MARYRGGCSCGAVRFELADDPLWVLLCHCDACKKRTGSAYGISVMVENASVKAFTGKTQSYVRTGDSGLSVRYEFCPNCGTTLRWHVTLVPNCEGFAGGTFDQPNDLKIAAEMYTDEALPWARLDCELSRPRAPDDAFRRAMVAKTKSLYVRDSK
jgi:hypothetical protein